MTRIKQMVQMVTLTRLFVTLMTMLLCALVAEVAQSATVFYQTGVSGGGQQFVYAPTTPISGTMTAPVPRFNGGLGTLIQADFEFAASATELLSNVVDGKFSGGGLLGFDSVDELGALNHVG